jgi:hypothetical protein
VIVIKLLLSSSASLFRIGIYILSLLRVCCPRSYILDNSHTSFNELYRIWYTSPHLLRRLPLSARYYLDQTHRMVFTPPLHSSHIVQHLIRLIKLWPEIVVYPNDYPTVQSTNAIVVANNNVGLKTLVYSISEHHRASATEGKE